MRVQKKPKHLHIEFIVTSHNSAALDFLEWLMINVYHIISSKSLTLGYPADPKIHYISIEK